MKAIHLRTEYLENPVGIDVIKPRLFWNCEGGKRQTAYRITARCEGEVVWDTGKVASSRMTHIPYGGKQLQSRQRIEWSVRLWDETGAEGEATSAFFEMGLLEAGDWRAKWIAGDYKIDPKTRYPADCFSKVFSTGNVVSARLYATACGLYEGCLNGKRIGTAVLTPGHTGYPKRIQYQTYDVTNLLQQGENELTFQLADGWYRGSCGANGLRNQYGEWAEPADVKDFAVSEFIFPHPEETTAYIALLMDRMQEIAAILGRADAAARYADVAVRVREGYQHLMTVPKFSLDTDRQAKLVRPLHLKMLNKQQTEYAKKRLLKALDNYGWRLGTGFLSTPFILDVLTEMDVEYAYRLLENEELPGWLCMPKQGATTIWENWEGPNTTKPASLNHYSKGAVCRWVFDTMCGIHVDGENHFVITPQPGGHFSYAKACYQSIFGMVESGWVRDGERCAFTVTVPANCTATVRLPDGTERTQECGTQTYTV